MSTIKLEDLLEETPVLRVGGDLRDYELDSVDGFLLSRIDGHTQAAMLAEMVGLSRFDLAHRLLRLASLGLVEWGNGGEVASSTTTIAQPSSPSASPGPKSHLTKKKPPKPESVLPDFPELKEDCDLSLDDKRRILIAYKNLETLNYWEILGIDGESSSAEIKQAYFKTSKIFHPDRYFGKDLGSYKERLHKVFMAIKKAHEVLGKPTTRALYRAECPPRFDILENRLTLFLSDDNDAQATSAEEIETERRLEERRKEIKAQRKQQKTVGSPTLAEAQERAQPHFEQGLRYLHDGVLEKAVECFKMASVMAPGESKFRMLYEDTFLQLNTNKARAFLSKARGLEEAGYAMEAGNSYAEAADLMPSMASYAVRAAEMYLKAGQVVAALEYAERGVSISPNRKEARLVAAAAQQANSDSTKARQHLKVVMSLDAQDDRAKDLMKQLEKTLEK